MLSMLAPAISNGTLQALTELTGEPRLNVALPIALQDAVAHCLEKVNVAIRVTLHSNWELLAGSVTG